MGCARLVRVGSPYNGVELAELDFEQSADVMYLAHIDHAPTKLNRLGHAVWEFETVAFGPTIAAPTSCNATATVANTDSANMGDAYFPQARVYVVTAIDDETGQESRISNSDPATNDLSLKRNYNSITWAGTGDRYRVYAADNQQSYGYIGTTTATSFTDDNITPDLSDGPPEGKNPFDAAGNYPSTVTFYEQRLMWARTKNRPNAVWGSRSGDYENMDVSRPQQDDDALALGLVAGRVNAVNQLVSTNVLLALCSDNIFKVGGPQQDDYLSPLSLRSRRQLGRGASRLGPLIVDDVVFYQPSVGSSVRALGYSFEADGQKSDDVTIFSPHLFEGFTIVSWAWAGEPRSIIWAVRSDGVLLCFTWEQAQQVWGWTQCEIDGLVKSCCVITESGEDRLYLAIERVIAGDPKIYIERMAASNWNDVTATCFLDCARTFAFDTPRTEITGLFHLEFREVVCLVDGFVERGHTVSGGKLTLDAPARIVTVGLPFTATIETLPLAFQGRDGWNTGKRQEAGRAVLRVVDSRGIKAGPDDDNLFEIKPREGEDYDQVPTLLNGLYEIGMAPVTDDQTSVVIQSSDPLPLTVTAVYLDPIVAA